jgi:hypothetical protein
MKNRPAKHFANSFIAVQEQFAAHCRHCCHLQHRAEVMGRVDLYRLASFSCGFVATLRPASLSAPFFQQHVLTSCLCIILVILAMFQTFSLLLLLLLYLLRTGIAQSV